MLRIMSDEPTAVLTKAQRGFLRGEHEPAQERTTKTRLRKRVRQGLIDFELLQKQLDDGDVQMIAMSFGPSGLEDFGGEELALALRSTVAFVYRVAREGGLDPETVIEDGVNEGKTNRLDVLEERFNQGDDSLTVAELEELAGAGRIDRDERQEWLSERFTDRPEVGFVDRDDPAGGPGGELDGGGGDSNDE